MNVYIISDPHFGHKWAAKDRGFPDTICHDECFIAKWNSVIGKRDLVYVLGDISMNNPQEYSKLAQLDGRKILISGNHDSGKGWIKKASRYFENIISSHIYHSRRYGYMIFSHMPVHPKELDIERSYGKIKYNIHGHIHSGYEIDDPRYINVCAEKIDMTPKTLDQLLKERKDEQN